MTECEGRCRGLKGVDTACFQPLPSRLRSVSSHLRSLPYRSHPAPFPCCPLLPSASSSLTPPCLLFPPSPPVCMPQCAAHHVRQVHRHGSARRHRLRCPLPGVRRRVQLPVPAGVNWCGRVWTGPAPAGSNGRGRARAGCTAPFMWDGVGRVWENNGSAAMQRIPWSLPCAVVTVRRR